MTVNLTVDEIQGVTASIDRDFRGMIPQLKPPVYVTPFRLI